MYRPGNSTIWKGRQDPGSERDVLHQVIKMVDLNSQIPQEGIVLLGFCSDVGVRRNLGRPGAVEGPEAIRKAMVNLAVHFDDKMLTDGGDVVVSGDNLELAQEELVRYAGSIVQNKSFPILLGGGHEISYAHGKAVLDAFPDQKVGMINFDPHFDLRAYPQGPHSGSWARQLFEDSDHFQYLPIGINPAVNIASMFDLMRERGQAFISMDELLCEEPEELIARISYFLEDIDIACMTLDLDVFSSGVAPGVSAVNPHGVLPHHIKPLMHEILKSDKLVSFDVAEMSPVYDDGRTAKLAAGFIYDVVTKRI